MVLMKRVCTALSTMGWLTNWLDNLSWFDLASRYEIRVSIRQHHIKVLAIPTKLYSAGLACALATDRLASFLATSVFATLLLANLQVFGLWMLATWLLHSNVACISRGLWTLLLDSNTSLI